MKTGRDMFAFGSSDCVPLETRAQLHGCIHTLVSHAMGRAVIRMLHEREDEDENAPMLDAALIRGGLLFEVLDETGVGAPLLSLVESCMGDAGGPSAELLDTLDAELRTEVDENVEYALYMMFHNRTSEYMESVNRVCMYETGKLLELIKTGMSVDAAIANLDEMYDATDPEESSEDESEDTQGEEEEHMERPCRCQMCQTWPTLETRFEQWCPPSSGVQRIVADALRSI